MFKQKGGGVKGLLNNVQKNCTFLKGWLPLPLYQSKVPFNVVNINLSKKPEWFLANTWGTVSVVRYNSNKDYSFPVRGCS